MSANRRGAWLTLVGIVALGGLSGCLDGDHLTVATAWTAAERAGFEADLRRLTPDAPAIRWIVLAPGDDLRRVVSRRRPPDLILGGPGSIYQEMEIRGRFEPDAPGWWIVRKSPIGLALRDETSRTVGTGLTFDDPRRDPVSLAWVEASLRSGPWADVYANLVRDAGGERAPGRQSGAALAAFERGETAIALARDPRWLGASRPESATFLADEPVDLVEGVAVVRGSRHARTASALLRALARRLRWTAPPRPERSVEAGSLLADLLGATLVDAHEELVEARTALDAAGRPAKPEMWMTRPPPWPPASVARILEREKNAMPLLETLAAQIAPEPDVRAWLLRSWLAPARPIDGAFLDELAVAVEGRLVRAPRFRSWLRAEWTAWARQRYRRVARQVKAGKFAGATS